MRCSQSTMARTAASGICCCCCELEPSDPDCIVFRIFSAFSARLLVDASSRRKASTSRKLVDNISASWALLWPVTFGEMIALDGGDRVLANGETEGPEGCGEADMMSPTRYETTLGGVAKAFWGV